MIRIVILINIPNCQGLPLCCFPNRKPNRKKALYDYRLDTCEVDLSRTSRIGARRFLFQENSTIAMRPNHTARRPPRHTGARRVPPPEGRGARRRRGAGGSRGPMQTPAAAVGA